MSTPSRSLPFDHVVTLMMENRSFDNLMGFLYEHDAPGSFIGRGESEFRGVQGKEIWNPDKASPPRKIFVKKAPFASQHDMCHPCPDPGEEYQPHVNCQLYGRDELPGDFASLPSPAPMNGFVRDYIRALESEEIFEGIEPKPEHYQVIMNCFPPESTPVISGLAREFAVSDEWHASVPSQTWCNRSFFHSAQSHGFVTNSDYLKWLTHNEAETLFERLGSAVGADAWRVYWDEADRVPLTRCIHPQLLRGEYDGNFRHFASFREDCARGDLPSYTFIQPRLIIDHNDMHPPVAINPKVQSSILAGEKLINEVYEAVRAGPKWLRTLFVIVFDEHGGCFDHWPPPRAAPPHSKPPYALQDSFQFDRFGVRVPAIFVSPYIAPRTVVRSTTDVPFDHTSMIKTVSRRWDLGSLTDRDRAAPDFGHVFSLSAKDARVETPSFTPRPYHPQSSEDVHETLLSGMQREFAHMVSHVIERPISRTLKTVGDWLHHVR